MPSSDFRSTLHHFTGSPLIGFAATEHRRAATCGHKAGAKTDLSCSVMSCTTVPPSIRRRVPGCCTSKVFTPSMTFAPVVRARLPLFPLASRGRLTTLQGSLLMLRTGSCSPPKGTLSSASTVGSPLPPATSYSAAWSLRWPDSHRQVHHRFQDTHYGFLNGKPATTSLLDLMGPWPVYVLAGAALVLAVWALMTWPGSGPDMRPSQGPWRLRVSGTGSPGRATDRRRRVG